MAMAATGQLNVIESPSQGSRSVDCFEKLVQIGEGTYGQVYMARDIQTTEIVALKKIRMDNEKEGFPITAIREIKLLKKLNHENVIKLKEIVTSPGLEKDDDQGKPDGNKYKGDIFMVFEYMDHDLAGLADRPGVRFTIPQIKCYMRQLLTGLHYCHVNQVLHRDIKGPNLLIDNEGNLKLADFGLSRSYSNEYSANLTNRVITLWYRPPELLFGTTKYGPAVDMWSVGCIFAELLHGKPIFPGKDEHDQLVKIFKLCGTPDEVNWPGVQKTPGYNHFKLTKMKRCVRDVFRHFGPHALELLDKMLTLDPAQRISVKDALDAEYFWTDPLPCDPKSLPKYESSHEFQTKKKRQQQWQNEENAKRLKMQHPQQRVPSFQQGGQHAQMRQGPSHSIHGSQPAVAAGASHQRLPPFQQGGQHAQMRQGPSHSIHGSQPAVAAGPSHQRLPPFQQGGQHAQMRQGPSHSIRDSQPAVAAGPSHRNGNPQGPSGGPGRYPPVVNPSGGHNHPYPPPQGRRAHNGSSSGLPAGTQCGTRSGGGSGY